jgi:hypothetical protein
MLTTLLIVAAAEAVSIASKDPLLEFDYSWSAEAAAVPALDRRFRSDSAKQKRDATGTAREDREARRKIGAGWNPHFFSRKWTTAGSSPRLLSLEAETGAYTGGAHGNSGTTALLWDRRLGRETSIDTLLARRDWWTGAIRQPFCTLLDRERSKRRGQPVKRTDMFGDCPAWNDLTATLEDKDHDRRFDHVRVTADAYVAGPYAEGDYVISLPISATMISRLKPEYRSSFEAQPPVQ